MNFYQHKREKLEVIILYNIMTTAKKATDEILYINFNQTHSCFVVGTDTGFSVYKTDPFREMCTRKFEGGMVLVEMLYQTNLFALVGGGKNPVYPSNKVLIWDDRRLKCIGELSFRSVVKGIKLTKDVLIVILDHKVCVHSLTEYKLLKQIDTITNNEGLCAMSGNPQSNMLATLTTEPGFVRLENLGTDKNSTISAHLSEIGYLSLNFDGTLLATASKKGTLIRVFDTTTGDKLHEFRRGIDSAVIKNISFDPLSKWMVVTSNKETIHIYSLQKEKKESEPKTEVKTESKDVVPQNTVSTLTPIKDILPSYFSSEWSHKQIKILGLNETNSIVTFGAKDYTLVIIDSKGAYYLVSFGEETPSYIQKCYM